MHQQRLDRFSKLMQENQIDGFVLNAGPTLTYLTGLHFHLTERPIVLALIPGKRPIVVLPGLETRKLEQTTLAIDLFAYPENPSRWPHVFKNALKAINTSTGVIGYESKQLRMLEYELLLHVLEPTQFKDSSAIAAQLRAVKDNHELEALETAVTIAQEALAQTLAFVRPGMKEFDLANELVMQLLRAGSEPNLPFTPIVSTGPNGANPHAKPSERRLASGDLLIIDWGASYHGYVSDLTRTFGIGDVEPEFQRIHDLVHQANRAGRHAGKPGAACSSVDDAARSVIEKAHYGDYFTHRTGHGIGMECHEDPYIRDDNELILQEGMTYTVEPGIYLPGKNGVRIEDDVVITSDGCRSLSDFPRALTMIG